MSKDDAAVRAGVTLPWNNGPTEGYIHRLKVLKRQGYGRGGIELLRRRMRARVAERVHMLHAPFLREIPPWINAGGRSWEHSS